MKSNKTSRSLVMSVVSLLLCMLMLIGATFAWYSKDVTSGENLIRIGAFNVDVLYSEDYAEWSDLADAVLFNDVELVPGEATKVMYIRVVNKNTYPVVVDASLIAKTVTDNNADLMFYSKAVTAVATEADLLAETGVSLATAAQFVTEVEVPASDGTNHGTFDTAILVALPGDSEAEGIEARFKIQLTAAQAHETLNVNATMTNITITADKYTEMATGEHDMPNLDAAVRFICNEDPEGINENPYKDYAVDFELSFSEPVLGQNLFLVGQYGEYPWIGGYLTTGESYESFNILQGLGMSVTYTDIVTEVRDFQCGIHVEGQNVTATLKLVMTDPEGNRYVIKSKSFPINNAPTEP